MDGLYKDFGDLVADVCVSRLVSLKSQALVHGGHGTRLEGREGSFVMCLERGHE